MFGLYAEHKTSRYIGINGRLGYRFLANELTLFRSIQGLYFDFGLKLYGGSIYRDARKLITEYAYKK